MNDYIAVANSQNELDSILKKALREGGTALYTAPSINGFPVIVHVNFHFNH